MTARVVTSSTKKSKTVKKAKPAAVKTSKPAKVKAPAAIKPAKPAKKARKFSLAAWNLQLGIVLVALAAGVVIFGGAQSAPLTTQYLAKDTLGSEVAGRDVLATATHHLADVRISWLVAAFLVVFAASFLLVATVWRKRYENWLTRGFNKMRWIGFGASTGLMGVTIAALSGITDLGYLLLIFGALVILGALSTITELIGIGRRLRKFTIITALFTAALPVVVIALTLAGALMYKGSLPVYLYYVYGSMFLFAGAVAVGCVLRLRQVGKWADGTFAEKTFMGWGFAAAVALALQVFAGAL